MFEDLNEIGKSDGGKKAASFGIAILVEALIVGAIIIAPLIFFSVLPDSELLTFLIAPPAPPPPPPPPPPPSEAAPPRAAVVDPTAFVAPTEIPREIPPPSMDEPAFVVSGPVNTGIATGAVVSTGVQNLLNTVATTTSAAPPPPPPKPKPKPVRVGGNVQESRLIRQVKPVYPPMAQKARVQGDVVLDVEVDEEGNVTEITVKSGHPLLVPAARDAVKQWKYSPTLLNGEPTPVMAEVTVKFKLS